MRRSVDVAILGAGTAGLSALNVAQRATDDVVLVNGGEPGTTCARVGCMPSKAIVQVADDYARRKVFDRLGIGGGAQLRIDDEQALEHVQHLRDIFVDRVLAGSVDILGDRFIDGYAEFLAPDLLRVDDLILSAKRVVIATGSRPVVPAAWQRFGARVLTTDDFFEQQSLAASIAVVGLGAVGLELGQAVARLGSDAVGFDAATTCGGMRDPVVARLAAEIIGQELPMHLGSEVTLRESEAKLAITARDVSLEVDRVLASLGRRPNVDKLALDKLGVDLGPDGVPEFDPHTMQVGTLPVFIAGDVTGTRAILHEAAHQGRIAGFNAVQPEPVAFKPLTPLAITFTDPALCEVGTPYSELDPDGIVVGEMRLGPLGRALIMARNKGIVRLYVDKHSAKLLGGAMVAPNAEHLGHLLAWCIERGLTVLDMLRLPFYHPTVEEALQSAARDALLKLGTPRQPPPELSPL